MEVLSPRSANIPMAPPKATRKPKGDSKPKPDVKLTNPDRIDDRWRPPPSITEPGPSPETYLMGKKLGKGGFAVCFEGKSKTTFEVFALKVVKAKVEQKKMMEKFRTELQIHAKMHHPNIVEFLRAFTIDEYTYVVLQMCPNGSLTEMVKTRSCLSLPEVRRFMIQICGGVKYMHKRSVIHRDLKMGNIFLDARMNIKIGDFGLAAVMADEHDRRTTLCGTPNYIAPEILSKSSNRGHDNKVDTWAVGVICYAMLMGTPPFQSKTQQEIYTKLRTLEYEWRIDSKNYIPQQAKDFVASCLNLNSVERPEMDELVEHDFFTMGAVADELETSCLRANPTWLENADPRGDKVQSGYGISHSRICRECGIGIGSDGRPRAGVGTGLNISTLVEIEAENREGCAPVVPLPPGTLYKQFSDAHVEWTARQKHPLLSTRVRSRKPIPEQPEPLFVSSKITKAETEVLPVMAPKAPLPPASSASRPFQSFAAQQRQQALPSGSVRRGPVGQEDIPRPKQQEVVEPPPQPLLRERPIRAATIRTTRSTTVRDAVSQISRTLPRSTTAPDGINEISRQESSRTGQEGRRIKSGIPTATPNPESQPTRNIPRSVGGADSATARPKSSSPTSEVSVDDIPPHVLQPTSGNDRQAVLGMAEKQRPANAEQRQRAESRAESARPTSLPRHQPRIIARTDRAMLVPQSSNSHVLGSLQDLHKALDPRRFDEAGRRPRSAYGTRAVRTRSTYPRVDKWVDYSTRHGIAYILSNGTVGMILKSSEDNSLPSSCVVVRHASSHTIRRAKGLEHQFVPQGPDAADVEFYEQSDYERGMKRLDVPAQKFQLDLESHPNQVAAAHAIQVRLEGSEAERMKEVALLDKFGKYMNKQGRHDDSTNAKAASKGEHFVHFYQRVGNVGVWRFADGGLQFNFPDHTKITIHGPIAEKDDEDGQYRVNCVYLMPTDAIGLASHGGLSGEAMERRDELSLPLEDIMDNALRRSEMEIVRTNEIKEKLYWARAVIGCWIKEGGLGKMGEERLGWSGLQERRDDKRIKLQWVTVGRFGGDGEGPGMTEVGNKH
ncbi:PLK protein kinase [Cladophialophora psammophila CBS 110553]|uniref:PLK protein kinase n=1 Tax=Cladophialophora psammophila CBS 110553 TaxID=1182543 RepID=W9X9G4_9EURO|nr:PLK protein kinase [Cladophialophora psammophila CBS 110553]EXJ73965.1 PLK protein kinase [Cladophialophora psammophila CBS 110553]